MKVWRCAYYYYYCYYWTQNNNRCRIYYNDKV